MKTNVWFSVLAGAALALLSSTAEAQVVPVPSAAGTNYIGSSGGFPIVLNGVTCTYNPLNSGHQAGPLIRTTEVRGSPNQPTNIYVVTAPTNVCGATLQPILRGAFTLNVVGGDAADTIANYSLSNVYLFGGRGDDVLISLGTNTGVAGEDGNDFLLGGGTRSVAQGNNGNDTVCSRSGAPIFLAIGGNGSADRMCGATITPPSSFEILGCSCPF